jgi:hypothetical protein
MKINEEKKNLLLLVARLVGGGALVLHSNSFTVFHSRLTVFRSRTRSMIFNFINQTSAIVHLHQAIV